MTREHMTCEHGTWITSSDFRRALGSGNHRQRAWALGNHSFLLLSQALSQAAAIHFLCFSFSHIVAFLSFPDACPDSRPGPREHHSFFIFSVFPFSHFPISHFDIFIFYETEFKKVIFCLFFQILKKVHKSLDKITKLFRNEGYFAFIFIIPFFIIFLIFRIYPFLLGVYTSFTNARVGPRPPKSMVAESCPVR